MCGIMGYSKSRVFISIYFPDGITEKRGRRDFTLSFDYSDELYRICKKLGSTGIKELIHIHSYKDLVEKAKAEHRSLSNYIKHELRSAIDSEKKNTIS
jgi:hypothetical protein